MTSDARLNRNMFFATETSLATATVRQFSILFISEIRAIRG